MQVWEGLIRAIFAQSGLDTCRFMLSLNIQKGLLRYHGDSLVSEMCHLPLRT